MPSPVWPLHFALIHGPNIPGSHAVLLFTVSDFTSITCHIHNWVLFLLWLHLFILSEIISPFFSSSILGTYWPGEFIFQCPIFQPFHAVHRVLKARILKCFAIPFSSGPCFVRTFCYDLSILVGPTPTPQFHWVRQSCGSCDQFGWFSVIVVFILSALWWIRLWGFWKLPDGRDWLRGNGLVLMGGAMFSKSLIQFSVDEWGCVPSLLLDLRSNYGGGNEDNGDLLQKGTQCPWPRSRPPPTHVSPGDSWTLMGMSGSVSYGVTAPFSWVLVRTRFCLWPPRVCFPSPL